MHSDVIERSHGSQASGTPAHKENAFTEIFAGYLDEFGISSGLQVCYFRYKASFGDIKVNAYSIDEESGTAELLITRYCDGEPVEITAHELSEMKRQVENFLVLATAGNYVNMEPTFDTYEMVERFHAAGNSINTVRAYLITDGIVAADKIEEGQLEHYLVSYDVWDIKRLYDRITSPLPYEPNTIDLLEVFKTTLPCLPASKNEDGYRSFLTYIPGNMIYNLYEQFGQSLLELNVRSFLQFRTKVNKGIRETILHEPHRFLAYNNGICATAEKVDVEEKNGVRRIRVIKGLQIVNGGQTVVAIHRAKKVDGADVDNILVQTKLTVLSSEDLFEMAPKISRYSNTQNRVTEADFAANDTYHRELEDLSRKIWIPGEQSRWFYERSRGQYQVERMRAADRNKFDCETPSSKTVNKTDLAMYLNAWDQYPHIVSLHAQKNFISFMNRIRREYDRNWKPDEEYFRDSITKVILFRNAKKIVDEHKDCIQSYRTQVTAYTISYLTFRTVNRLDLGRIWAYQEISHGIKKAIKSWCEDIYDQILSTGGNRNIGEWCKKEECWQAVKNLKLSVPQELSDETDRVPFVPNVGKPGEQQGAVEDPEAQENIARVVALKAIEWTHIAESGHNSGEQNDFLCKLAITLSEYAALGWNKIPSAKQAYWGVQLLNWYEEYTLRQNSKGQTS